MGTTKHIAGQWGIDTSTYERESSNVYGLPTIEVHSKYDGQDNEENKLGEWVALVRGNSKEEVKPMQS